VAARSFFSRVIASDRRKSGNDTREGETVARKNLDIAHVLLAIIFYKKVISRNGTLAEGNDM